MIRLGLDAQQKLSVVLDYVRTNGISRVFVLGAPMVIGDVEASHVSWDQIIQYRFYYRLLQEIDTSSLVVVNECLRTQNRHDLTYNCIRNFLQQTKHQVIFQRLPIIDRVDDMAILVDLDTRSRWKRDAFRADMLGELDVVAVRHDVSIEPIRVQCTPRQRSDYATAKEKLFAELGHGDPHSIPRNLHMVSGKARLAAVEPGRLYVARNSRAKKPNVGTYGAVSEPRVLLDFCHRFIDFTDHLAATGQRGDVEALVTDLPVDEWYLKRFSDWSRRLGDAYAAIHG
jgi:hypothetical protein